MTTTTAQQLSFTRLAKGAYVAKTDTKVYDVARNDVDGAWTLAIFEARKVAGLTIHGDHLDTGWSDTMADAKAVAQAYADLGDDYRQCDHGYRARYTEAVRTLTD